MKGRKTGWPWIAAAIAASGCAVGTSADPGDADGGAAVLDGGAGRDADPRAGDGGGPDTSGGPGRVDAADGASGVDAGDGGARDAAREAGDADSVSDSGCATPTALGTLVTYALANEPGNQASTPATGPVAGLTASALTRSGALTAVAGAGSINASDWGTGNAADPTRYYAFTVTPAAGCTLELATLALDVKASGTGPTTGDVSTSASAFSARSASFAGTSTPSVSLAGVQGTSAIEIRIFGYGATATGGTMRLQTSVTLSGRLR